MSDVLGTAVVRWNPLASVLAAGAEPSDLTVAQRTYLVANAIGGKVIVYRIAKNRDTRANAMRFRCASTADGAACTFVLYTGTLGSDVNIDCDLTYLGTLAFTTGLQQAVDSGYLMADQVTVTEGDTTAQPSANWKSRSVADDRVAEASIDLQGADVLIIVPTVVGSDCKLYGKAY